MSLSPSKLSDAAGCIRRFAWDEVDPLPYVQNREAELGQAVHRVGQDYHEIGKAPDPNTDEGKIFRPALPHVPTPRKGTCEGKFDFRVGALEFTGVIDLSCNSGDLPGAWPGMPAVLDYKSIKALTAKRMLGVKLGKDMSRERWYELNKPSFLADLQALIYAAKRLVQTKQQRVFLRWLYLRRGEYDEKTGELVVKPKAEPRDTILTLAEVTEAFGRLVHPLATRLVQIRRDKTDPLSLPPNPNRCMLYGPKYACPRIGQCNLSANDALQLEDDSDMDLLDELMQEENEKPAPAREPEKPKGINPEPLKPASAAAKSANADTPAKSANADTANKQEQKAQNEAAKIGAAVVVIVSAIRDIWNSRA